MKKAIQQLLVKFHILSSKSSLKKDQGSQKSGIKQIETRKRSFTVPNKQRGEIFTPIKSDNQTQLIATPRAQAQADFEFLLGPPHSNSLTEKDMANLQKYTLGEQNDSFMNYNLTTMFDDLQFYYSHFSAKGLT